MARIRRRHFLQTTATGAAVLSLAYPEQFGEAASVPPGALKIAPFSTEAEFFK